uniref:Uncharacterized protein n=1 Tax=viral metagenome TaxID=1070528 RepID=A0A6C0LN58_9ZZZZ
MASEFATFADLSGVVQSLIKDLEGKVLSQTDLIKHLPKLVLVAWTNNLSVEKAEAQILAAVKHLIVKFVPAAQQITVTGFVDAAFPAIVTALNGLIEQVKAEVLKKATGALGDVGKKVEAVCSKSCLPWISALFAKASEKPAAVDPVAAPAAAESSVTVAVIAEAASSDISAALASVKEEVVEPEPEPEPEAKAE